MIQVDKVHHELHSKAEMVLDYSWGLSCCFSRHPKVKGGQHCHLKKAVVIAAVVHCPLGSAVALQEVWVLQGLPCAASRSLRDLCAPE